MKMKRTLPALAICSASILILASCGTDPHRIDPAGTQGITTVNDINAKDWQMAAESCINSMLMSGAIDRKDGRKTVLMISDIKNDTQMHVDSKILTNSIREALLKSGKAITTTAVGAAGPEDAATKRVRDLQNSELFDQRTVQPNGTAIAPDMSIAGDIIQVYVEEGRYRESTVYFHITLTNLRTGLAEWEGQSQVAKQSKKNIFGF